MDALVTKEQRTDVEKVEKVMRKWCDTAKGKDKTMCYYLGVGDAESVSRAVTKPCATALGLSPLTAPCIPLPRARAPHLGGASRSTPAAGHGGRREA